MKKRRALKIVVFAIQVMALFCGESAAGSTGLQASVEAQLHKDGKSALADNLA